MKGDFDLVQTRLLATKFVFLLRQVPLRKGILLSTGDRGTGLTYLWTGGLGASRLLDGLLVAGRVFRLGDGAPKQRVLDDKLLGRGGRTGLWQTEEHSQLPRPAGLRSLFSPTGRQIKDVPAGRPSAAP